MPANPGLIGPNDPRVRAMATSWARVLRVQGAPPGRVDAVEDVARGQTAKCGDEPGGHKFHVNVHTGTPGTFAFGQAGKVSVDKVAAPTC